MIAKLMRGLLRRFREHPNIRLQLLDKSLRERYQALGITVGMHSYGCFDPGRFPPGVSVGRYCSIAPTSQVFLRNHGIGFLGLSAYFFNESLGVVSESTVPASTIDISDDVWIGHNAVILPDVRKIGRGAVIAAGSVVTKAVPAYAIVAGNPARVIRYRFDESVIEQIEATRWWQKEPSELRALLLTNPELVFDPATHFAGEHEASQPQLP